MVHLPFDVHQLGRLARRDLERACHLFLESSADDMSGVLGALKGETPPEWDPDLLPLLSWLAEAVAESPAGWSPDELLHRLFDPNCIALSPISLVRKPLAPGDEISEVLARRMGGILHLVGGEGDRLVSLDTVVLLLGSHLGYLSASSDHIRGKRVTRLEQEAIVRGYARMRLVYDLYGAQDSRNALLHLECERLALAPNFDLPATLRRLEHLSREQRALLWSEVLEHQRRSALPAERRPSFSMLLDRIVQHQLPVEAAHLTRLLTIAGHLHGQLQRNPDVDTGYVHTTLAELEEYLHWEPAVTILPRYRSPQGVRLLNRALLQLAAGHRSYGWPASLESELIEFRESFLKRLHERRLEDLLCIDPAEWIRHGLRRNHDRMIPELGEPGRLLEAWGELDLELSVRLENAPLDWLPGDELEKTPEKTPEKTLESSLEAAREETSDSRLEPDSRPLLGIGAESDGELASALEAVAIALDEASHGAEASRDEGEVSLVVQGIEAALSALDSTDEGENGAIFKAAGRLARDEGEQSTPVEERDGSDHDLFLEMAGLEGPPVEEGSAQSDLIEALEDDGGSDADDFLGLNEDSISLVVKISEEVQPVRGESGEGVAGEGDSDETRPLAPLPPSFPVPFLRRSVVEGSGESAATRPRAVASIPPPVSDDETPAHDWDAPAPTPSVVTLPPESPAASGPDDLELGLEEHPEAGKGEDLDLEDGSDEDPSVSLRLEVDEASLEVRPKGAAARSKGDPFASHGSLPFADTGLSSPLPFAEEEDADRIPQDQLAAMLDLARDIGAAGEGAGLTSAFPVPTLEAADEGLEAADEGLEVADEGLEAADEGLEAADEGLEVADEGLEVADEGVEAADEGLEAADEGVEAADEGLEVADEGLEAAVEGVEAAEDDLESEEGLEDPDGAEAQPVPMGDDDADEDVAAGPGAFPVDDWSDVRAATTGSLPVPMPEDDSGDSETAGSPVSAAVNPKGELEQMVRELGKVVQELENADIDLEPILGFQREASSSWTPLPNRPSGPEIPAPARPVKIPRLHPLLVSQEESEESEESEQDEWETPREADGEK